MATRVGGGMRRTLDAALAFALPPRCPGCGTVVDGDHRFCAACWMQLDFLGEPACATCGVPLEIPGPCEACAVRPPVLDRVRAAVAYGAIATTVVLRLKHGRRPGVARTLATLMTRLVADAPADALVAAVPLHRWRLWARGYNQALLIARGVARGGGLAVIPDLVERTRATPVLRGLGRGARAEAVRDAFAVPARHHGRIAGRVVILVDDVFTTGATAEACAVALKRAGAAEVRLVCWARVVRDR